MGGRPGVFTKVITLDTSQFIYREGSVLSFNDIGFLQADVLFEPFVKSMISELRKFLVWSKEMQDFLLTLNGPEEKKLEALHYLQPEEAMDDVLNEMEKLLVVQ